MTTIHDFSDKELEEELKRRKYAKPQMIEHPNLNGLRNVCQDYIDALSERGEERDDIVEYIFETAMETFFDVNIWDYIAHVKNH